jgi:formylglycine-generating enzyme required for sulfatase activity
MKQTLLLVFILISVLLVGCNSDAESNTLLTIQTGIDPDSWVNVPSGEFLMGQHEHEIMVDYDYQIMVTDVTVAQFAGFINKALADGSIGFEEANPVGFYPGDEFRGFRHEEEIVEGWYQLAALDDVGMRIILDGQLYIPHTSYTNHPVTMVSWFGAKTYCEYYGWRLPTEVEWEKAARGTEDNRALPWGNNLELNNANFYSSHDIFEKLAGKGDTTPVGFYNGKTYDGYETLDSSSPYGLYDMAGNVWQWTGDVYEDQHYRYMRGGSKENYGYNLRVWTRNSAGPTYYSPSVGFRCARDSN